MHFHFDRLRRKGRELLRGAAGGGSVDAIALQALGPLSTSYVPWTVMSMRPSAVATVLNDVVINRRRCIVECGGGISTIYLARLLAQLGKGHVYTVEHDGDWARVLGDAIAAEALSDRVTMLHAPLAPSPHSWDGATWYSHAALEPLHEIPAVDLLVVDGPPAHAPQNPHARYPALPYFRNLMADDFTVMLDDIRRRGELEIVERWEAEFGLPFERRFANGSIALGHSRSGMLV